MSEKDKGGLATCTVSNISLAIKISNIINACLLALAAILALVDISFQLILLITAIYVALFAVCLLCFELRLSIFESVVYRNFGFMFGSWGRAGFFIFIGSLSIAFNSVTGWLAVAYTGANLLFNCYCMAIHKEYREWLAKDNAERKLKAMADVKQTVARTAIAAQGRSSTDASKPVALDVTPESAFSNAPAGGAGGMAGWEKLYDEKTKLYYYHNSATGETRWEEPS